MTNLTNRQIQLLTLDDDEIEAFLSGKPKSEHAQKEIERLRKWKAKKEERKKKTP